MEFRAEEWGRKGTTLSDKTARSEYGLTQEEIFAAINAGELQYRPAAMHGNPWLRLLRREVEDLVRTRRGERYLRERKARTELAQINRELKHLRAQLATLEERRAALVAELAGQGDNQARPQTRVRDEVDLAVRTAACRKLAAVMRLTALIDPERQVVPRFATPSPP